MKKEHKHETISAKFWRWWDCADMATIGMALFVTLLTVTLVGGFVSLLIFAFTKTDLPADKPLDGVGRVQTEEAEAHLAGEKVYEEQTAHRIDTYTEWEGTAPHWYRPWEEIAAEWTDDNAWHSDAVDSIAHAPVGIDAGGMDWNLCTTLWGWDGHGMEVWEMDLFSRIVYLEFWGTSRECVEAGIDSMLLLWDMGEYGRTMGELLSAQYAPGYYVYSPYAYVWDWDYDAEGLNEIRAMCEERFAAGPEWCAPYFRLWYYHDFGIPAYEIDGVYFSAARW